MLLNTLREPELLKALTVAYFNPETKQNPGLQQALTYFLPVYCHTRKENAERMASIAVPLIHAMHTLTRDLDEDEKAEMVGLKVIGAQIADWTDPRKLVGVEDVMGEPNEDAQKIEGLGDAHLILAEEILEKLMTPGSQSKFPMSRASRPNKPQKNADSFTRGRKEYPRLDDGQAGGSSMGFSRKGPKRHRPRPRNHGRR